MAKDINVFGDKPKPLQPPQFRRLEGDILSLPHKSISRNFIKDNVIVFGSGDRPTNADTGVFAHFDTGTGVLSLWSGTAWLTTTLS
jgi:hypothetical protein